MKILGRILVCIITLAIFIQPSVAQVLNNTEQVDTAVVVNEITHSPKKATIYSAILPGLGQAYNKKYWKIPIVYLGFGALAYFIDWNNDSYQLYKSGYLDLTDDDETTTSYMKIEGIDRFDLTNSTELAQVKDALIKSQDYYRRNRDFLIISTAAFYALNIIDASVDAHFYNLDLTDDLTFNWQPSIHTFNNENIYCLTCTFTF